MCTRKGYAASVSRLTSSTATLYFPFSIPKSGRKRSAHGRRRFVQRFPGRQTKAVSFHRGNSPRIWRNSGFQIDSAVEEVFHILAGAFREKGNHHGGQQTGGEAGDDLVDVGGGQEYQPQDIHCGTGGNACHRSAEGEPLPEQAQQNDGAEGRAEDAPGVFHQTHDGTGVGVGGDHQRDNGDDDDHDASSPEHFGVGSLLADDGLIDIAGKGGGRRQKLGVGRRHGGGQNRGQQQTGYQRGEDAANHGDEHGGGILNFAQIQAAGDGGQGGHDQDDGRPGNADHAGLAKFLLGFQGHKPDDDVGHTEVAKAPAKAGNDVLRGGEEVEEAAGQGRAGRGTVACFGQRQSEQGGDQQCGQHDHALEEIRPAHRAEAAKEGVGHNDEGGDVHGNGGINVHDRVEQGAAGLDGGGGVDGVGHKENDGAEDLQGLILAQEPVGQVLGDGDGIIGSDGEPAQPGRHEDPAHGVADAKANGDPCLPHAA